MSYNVRLYVYGPRACFPQHVLQANRVSYYAMTPMAARRILESIYSHPSFMWIVDTIYVQKPIILQKCWLPEAKTLSDVTRKRRGANSSDREQVQAVVDNNSPPKVMFILKNVEYIIEAHLQMTEAAEANDNVQNHLKLFNRQASSGQYVRPPCLGIPEFRAGFELLSPDLPFVHTGAKSRKLGFGTPRDLGLTLFDTDRKAPSRQFLWFYAVLDNGMIRVPHPDSAEVYR